MGQNEIFFIYDYFYIFRVFFPPEVLSSDTQDNALGPGRNTAKKIKHFTSSSSNTFMLPWARRIEEKKQKDILKRIEERKSLYTELLQITASKAEKSPNAGDVAVWECK